MQNWKGLIYIPTDTNNMHGYMYAQKKNMLGIYYFRL